MPSPVVYTEHNWGSAIPSCVTHCTKLGQCHPQLCNTLRKTGEVTYREGDGAYREGEVKEVDAGCRGKSGGLFLLALRNEDAFDIPLIFSTLNSYIWLGCTE